MNLRAHRHEHSLHAFVCVCVCYFTMCIFLTPNLDKYYTYLLLYSIWTNPFVDGIHKHMLIDCQLKTRVLFNKDYFFTHKSIRSIYELPIYMCKRTHTPRPKYTKENTTCIQEQTNLICVHLSRNLHVN